MLIPLILTVATSLAALALGILLLVAALRRRNATPKRDEDFPADLKDFGPVAANEWIRGLRNLLVVLMICLLATHAYWVFWAKGNDAFVQAKKLDGRNLRLAESGLKGWVFDRSGTLENALVRYRADAGLISRDYPLGAAAVHLTGYSDFVYGSGGLEYAYRQSLTAPASIKNELVSPVPVGKDITVSIDGALQREAYNLLQNTGKAGGIVVLLLPDNEILSMASTPSFDPKTLTSEENWLRLSRQADDTPQLSPLLNRALGTLVTGGASLYYRPGSTFKTFTAAVAIESGLTNEKFTCRGEGFTPPGSNRPIKDYEGEVHGTIGFQDAFRLSCNQYFAQLGLKLGKERLANYARRLGFSTGPEDGGPRAVKQWAVAPEFARDFNFIFAAPTARMNLSRSATDYDVALQSFGQGYDDMTVFEMALMVAAVAGDGNLVPPTFAVSKPGAHDPSERKVSAQFISPQSAAALRELMKLVVQSGTAAGAFHPLAGHIGAGGKTGTADRQVPLYDRNGDQVFDYVDDQGRTHYKFQNFTDSWFIGFAPADHPQIAYAVMVENGGQGAKTAAPIAVKLIQKAAALGYVTGK